MAAVNTGQTTSSSIDTSYIQPSYVLNLIKPSDKRLDLTEKQINNIVDSIGLMNSELVSSVKSELKNSKIYRRPEILINLAGHPCAQYYILQQEEKYIETVKNNIEIYKHTDSRMRANINIKINIAKEIAKVIAIGFDKAFDPNVMLNQTTATPVVEPGSRTQQPYSVFNQLNIPVNVENTCNNPPKRGGTRRRIRGQRITKRRFN
jgi:hypothetical protein